MFMSEPEVHQFINQLVQEQPVPPTDLRHRNAVQLQLVERVIRNFDVDRVDALVLVAHAFSVRYPHPVSRQHLYSA